MNTNSLSNFNTSEKKYQESNKNILDDLHKYSNNSTISTIGTQKLNIEKRDNTTTLYSSLTHFAAKQPLENYIHALPPSENCILFCLDTLSEKHFPQEYQELPTIQTKSEKFNFQRFQEAGRVPVPLYKLNQPETDLFHQTTNHLVQDMPIKIPGENLIAIPESAKQFLPVIKQIFSYEKGENNSLDEYYAYLTIDQRNLKIGTSLRSPGWHVDGMHVRQSGEEAEKISRVYTIVVTDSKNNITEYTTQSFRKIVDIDSSKYDIFKAFDQLIHPASIHQAPCGTLCYMDAYTVHRSPEAISEVGKRTFLRVQLTPKQFNRIGNTINPHFKNIFSYEKKPFPILEDPQFSEPIGYVSPRKMFNELHDPCYQFREKDESSIRILSWNIRHFTNLDDQSNEKKIIDVIGKFNADIIALQECSQNGEIINGNIVLIHHDWEVKLKKLNGVDHTVMKCFADHTISSASILRQQALALVTPSQVNTNENYIFPEELQYPDWPDSKLGFQIANVETKIGAITLVNTHLDVMDSSGLTRRAQLELIIEKIEPIIQKSLPVLILGDFNSVNYKQIIENDQIDVIKKQDLHRNSFSSTELSMLYEKGFKEVFDLTDEKKAPWVSVWSMRRVDFCFVVNNQELSIDPEIPSIVYSDHFPLVVNIKKKEKMNINDSR